MWFNGQYKNSFLNMPRVEVGWDGHGRYVYKTSAGNWYVPYGMRGKRPMMAIKAADRIWRKMPRAERYRITLISNELKYLPNIYMSRVPPSRTFLVYR